MSQIGVKLYALCSFSQRSLPSAFLHLPASVIYGLSLLVVASLELPRFLTNFQTLKKL